MDIEQYKAVRETSAGIFTCENRGLIEVSGGEAVKFLNGLVTNDVAKLENYSWMLAAFPNAQGRILAFVRVLRIEDKFIFDVEAENYQTILQNLTRFTFAGDFKVADLSQDYGLISINGKRAFEIVNYFLQVPNALDKIIETEIEGEKVFVIRDSSKTGEKGFDIFAPKKVYDKVLIELKSQGAIEVADETREVLRVEAGNPKYGVDVDGTNVVLESGLDAAVSFTKGCYIGQEIIARIHFRGHVAKQLRGLIIEESQVVKVGDELKSVEGKAAGKITSIAFSPKLNKQIALAMVRYEFLKDGSELLIGENSIKSTVTQTPFIK